jgi:hypothetical protein
MPVASVNDAMKDIALVLVTIGFFALGWIYTRALDRL